MRFGKRSFWGAAAVGLLLLSGIPGSEGALKVSKDGSFLADKMSFAPRKNNTVKMTPDNNGVYQYVQTGKDPVLSCQLEPSDRLLLVDGKSINISQDFPRDKKDFFRNRKAESISIPLFWGRRLNITGNMRITLEDSRFYTEYSLGGAYLLEIKPEKKGIAPCAEHPGIRTGIHSDSAGFLRQWQTAGVHKKNTGGKVLLSEF